MVDTKKTDIGSNESDAEASSDFNLKHRVAGAACLLFFGALVLPWLLGPPSAASKTPTALTVDANEGEISAMEIENEILAGLEDNTDIETEQVYISKITPLDAVRLEEEKKRAEAEELSKSSAAAMAMADVGESAGDDDAKKAIVAKTDKPEEAEAAQKQPEQKQPPKEKVTEIVKETVEKAKSQEVVKNTSKTTDSEPPKAVVKPAVNTRQEDLVAALAAETGTSSDVGWVVQVGVFTDKKGAEKVVKDLTTKGFKPSTSVVDTNRGKGTGTRVWLGPFTQRVDAAKTKTRLTDRTGEPGFIRAYP